MAGQVMKTLDLGKPSKNEKNEKKTNLCRHGRYQRHPPSTRLPQEARPPASGRRSPHCRATGAHLDTEIVVKAVASIPVNKTDSDASRDVRFQKSNRASWYPGCLKSGSYAARRRPYSGSPRGSKCQVETSEDWCRQCFGNQSESLRSSKTPQQFAMGSAAVRRKTAGSFWAR